MIRDQFGDAIHVGDRVYRTAIDYGAPASVTWGTVVGAGRSRIYVEWDSRVYGSGMFAHNKPHSVVPQAVRVMERGGVKYVRTPG